MPIRRRPAVQGPPPPSSADWEISRIGDEIEQLALRRYEIDKTINRLSIRRTKLTRQRDGR